MGGHACPGWYPGDLGAFRMWRGEGAVWIAEAGARRYAREGVAFSYENCLIAELEGATVGMAHSFAMEEDPEAVKRALVTTVAG